LATPTAVGCPTADGEGLLGACSPGGDGSSLRRARCFEMAFAREVAAVLRQWGGIVVVSSLGIRILGILEGYRVGQ